MYNAIFIFPLQLVPSLNHYHEDHAGYIAQSLIATIDHFRWGWWVIVIFSFAVTFNVIY